MSKSALTGTKLEILALLLQEELSANALSGLLDMTGAAIRQHLQTLVALGMIERRKQGNHPGRPAYLYRLSAEGKRQFRQRHDLLLSLIVQTLVRREGAGALSALLRDAAMGLADERFSPYANPRAEAEWNAFFAQLEDQLGWKADTSASPGGAYRLTLHQCPFQGASEDQAGVCGTFFRALIERVCGSCIVEHAPVTGGVACCMLLIRPPAA